MLSGNKVLMRFTVSHKTKHISYYFSFNSGFVSCMWVNDGTAYMCRFLCGHYSSKICISTVLNNIYVIIHHIINNDCKAQNANNADTITIKQCF